MRCRARTESIDECQLSRIKSQSPGIARNNRWTYYNLGRSIRDDEDCVLGRGGDRKVATQLHGHDVQWSRALARTAVVCQKWMHQSSQLRYAISAKCMISNVHGVPKISGLLWSAISLAIFAVEIKLKRDNKVYLLHDQAAYNFPILYIMCEN